jgi:hypothetical protein
MTPAEAHEANIERLLPPLLEIVEGEPIADAAVALCAALATLAFRAGFTQRRVLSLTRESIKEIWAELKAAEANNKGAKRQ